MGERGRQVQAALHLALEVEEDEDGGVDVGGFVEHEHCGGGEEAHLCKGQGAGEGELSKGKSSGEMEELDSWTKC